MDGPHQPASLKPEQASEPSALERVANDVRGVAQLLSHVATTATLPLSLRSGLQLLARTLDDAAGHAEHLIDDVDIDISSHVGITTTDLANMRFSPVNPPFRRQPGTMSAWRHAAESDFALWGKIEEILAEDDTGLEQRFRGNPDDHLSLVDAMELMRERAQGDIKLIEATLLRLAVAVARWEQSGES